MTTVHGMCYEASYHNTGLTIVWRNYEQWCKPHIWELLPPKEPGSTSHISWSFADCCPYTWLWILWGKYLWAAVYIVGSWPEQSRGFRGWRWILTTHTTLREAEVDFSALRYRTLELKYSSLSQFPQSLKIIFVTSLTISYTVFGS